MGDRVYFEVKLELYEGSNTGTLWRPKTCEGSDLGKLTSLDAYVAFGNMKLLIYVYSTR